MFTWEISSLALTSIDCLNIDYFRRIGVNREFSKQRVDLLTNFSKSGRVEANGFDFMSGESTTNALIAKVLLELITLHADMSGQVCNPDGSCPLIA